VTEERAYVGFYTTPSRSRALAAKAQEQSTSRTKVLERLIDWYCDGRDMAEQCPECGAVHVRHGFGRCPCRD